MPKYMMSIVESQEGYENPDPADFEAIMKMHQDFAAAVNEAGAKILDGEALQPATTATFLRGTRTPDVTVVDNPAPDLKEVLGGYYLIEAADDAQALELAKMCPAPHGYIELRPVWEFGES
jgi:hypothetical protein